RASGDSHSLPPRRPSDLVARDLIVRILTELGAETVPLGRSDVFVPVDTEALRPEDIELLSQWAKESRFDAIVSTDGDADRPLIADRKSTRLNSSHVNISD